MRDSIMLLVLAKTAGDLNPEEEARLLGGGGETFVEEAKLTDSEESEVARRVGTEVGKVLHMPRKRSRSRITPHSQGCLDNALRTASDLYLMSAPA